MAPSNLNRLFGGLLLSASLISRGQASVTCSTVENNVLSNPSFESGDMSSWTGLYAATGPTWDGEVECGDASDGDYYL
jgi:hypothetical protein